MSIADIYAVLGGRKTLGVPTQELSELRHLIEKGLPFPALESVRDTLALSRAEVLDSLGITPRTLARRKKEQKLQPTESDRLFRLARVAALGIEVLGDTGKLRRWLHKPNRALGGDVPLELLSTDIGSRQVEEELIAIDHGIFA